MLARIRFDPGASFPIEATDPSVTLVSVKTGTVTVQVEVPITVMRAATIAAFASPGVDESVVPPPEVIAASTRFAMTVGDSASFPANIAGGVRNVGREATVILIASIEPPEGGVAGPPAP